MGTCDAWAVQFSAEDAERIGLIWKCIDDDRLDDQARGLSSLRRPRRGWRCITAKSLRGVGKMLDQQLDLERDTQRDG